jgi:NADPH:quinone reductase
MPPGMPVLRVDMSAVVVATAYGGPEVLTVVDRPAAEPGPGQARIEVRACGINPVDYKLCSGAMGDDPARLPLSLGFEAAGVVTAVGPDAVGPLGPVAVGDEVIAYRVAGAYAADLVAPAQALVPKPRELSWPEASGLMLAGANGTELRSAARPELARLAGDGTLRVPVSRTFPLENAGAAHRAIMAGHTLGKMALIP